jgi:hypothetical protein
MQNGADSSKLLHGTSGNGTSGNCSGGQSERLTIPGEGQQHPATASDTQNLLPSPTVRSPAPTPAPSGVNVGAAFRNHGRLPPDEPAPTQARCLSNLTASAVPNQNPTACSSEDAGDGNNPSCTPVSFNHEQPGESPAGHASGTRAPSEEATLANIAEQNGMQSSLNPTEWGSWPEVQMGSAGGVSGNVFTERASGNTRWTTPEPHMVQGQHGVAVTGNTKYPAVSGASVPGRGMMAVPLGMHANGPAYAMPTGGFQQFVQPGRAQQVGGGTTCQHSQCLEFGSSTQAECSQHKRHRWHRDII